MTRCRTPWELVNGTAGGVLVGRGHPVALMAFTICDGKISEIYSIGDRERLQRLAAGVLVESGAARLGPSQCG
jgi:hypothetical protein